MVKHEEDEEAEEEVDAMILSVHFLWHICAGGGQGLATYNLPEILGGVFYHQIVRESKEHLRI